MPKLACPCGFVHDLSGIPDEGWVAIRDKDMEDYIQHERAYADGFNAPEESEERKASDAGGRAMAQMTTLFYECPKCGRIMWRKTRDEGFRIYARENPKA
ncbi:hypothetical protein [Prosthecobacter sp.]|uniref:hypothetical protein n=1 Tax=Prosthecobacter sp. TaxID=1965333 RepID=UPI0037843D1E